METDYLKVHGWTPTDPDADPAPDPALFVSDLQDANKSILVFMLIPL